MIAGVDHPSSVCAFEQHLCSMMVNGHGGFDLHHRWPKEMGGAEHQSDELVLCPIHHRRQHSLVRYLVECHLAVRTPRMGILGHFAALEQATADYAVASWIAAGQPVIPGWSSPAARP